MGGNQHKETGQVEAITFIKSCIQMNESLQHRAQSTDTNLQSLQISNLNSLCWRLILSFIIWTQDIPFYLHPVTSYCVDASLDACSNTSKVEHKTNLTTLELQQPQTSCKTQWIKLRNVWESDELKKGSGNSRGECEQKKLLTSWIHQTFPWANKAVSEYCVKRNNRRRTSPREPDKYL